MTFKIGNSHAIGLTNHLNSTINQECVAQTSSLSTSSCSTTSSNQTLFSDESSTFGIRSRLRTPHDFYFAMHDSLTIYSSLQVLSMSLSKFLTKELDFEFEVLKKCFVIFRNTHSDAKVREYALKNGYPFSFFQRYFKVIENYNAYRTKISANEAWAKAIGSRSIDPLATSSSSKVKTESSINPLYIPTLMEILEPQTFKV